MSGITVHEVGKREPIAGRLLRLLRGDAGLYLVTGALAALSFCLIYGVQILDPTYVDWLLSGRDATQDLTEHYLGWVAFRNAPWGEPSWAD